jgi:hypothetical protein
MHAPSSHPQFNGKPAAYFLCQSLVYDYFLFFDCRPNLPDFNEAELEKAKAPYPILEFVNTREFSRIITLQRLFSRNPEVALSSEVLCHR